MMDNQVWLLILVFLTGLIFGYCAYHIHERWIKSTRHQGRKGWPNAPRLPPPPPPRSTIVESHDRLLAVAKEMLEYDYYPLELDAVIEAAEKIDD